MCTHFDRKSIKISGRKCAKSFIEKKSANCLHQPRQRGPWVRTAHPHLGGFLQGTSSVCCRLKVVMIFICYSIMKRLQNCKKRGKKMAKKPQNWGFRHKFGLLGNQSLPLPYFLHFYMIVPLRYLNISTDTNIWDLKIFIMFQST